MERSIDLINGRPYHVGAENFLPLHNIILIQITSYNVIGRPYHVEAENFLPLHNIILIQITSYNVIGRPHHVGAENFLPLHNIILIQITSYNVTGRPQGSPLQHPDVHLTINHLQLLVKLFSPNNNYFFQLCVFWNSIKIDHEVVKYI